MTKLKWFLTGVIGLFTLSLEYGGIETVLGKLFLLAVFVYIA